MLDIDVKKNRTFSTVAEFIAWASGSRIKNKASKTIQLTRDDPHLLMLSTLARVLDVLDGRIALIAQN
jgi:DNA gyrase inhibitor GyrI